jgi:hypothetical protein
MGNGKAMVIILGHDYGPWKGYGYGYRQWLWLWAIWAWLWLYAMFMVMGKMVMVMGNLFIAAEHCNNSQTHTPRFWG